MTTLKLTANVSRVLPARNNSGWSTRAFAVATPSHSQSRNEKETAEASENVKDAAAAVKEGAKAVKRTCDYVRDTAAKTSDAVTKMSKEVTDKAKDIIVDAAKETILKGKDEKK